MTPADMLRKQGFFPLPGAFATVASEIAGAIRAELESHDKFEGAVGVGDAYNKLASVRDFIHHDTVRACYDRVFAERPAFLQACDVHAGFVQGNWHRDCANKSMEKGRDWDEGRERYRNYKLMIYLECDDYSFCVKPRTNRKLGFFERAVTDAYTPISVEAAATTDFAKVRTAVQFIPKPGDAVMFDLRTTHRGQGLNSEQYSKRASNKLTLSYVFADRNDHAHRFHSYRTILKQGYKPLSDRKKARLAEAGLWWDRLDVNYFDANRDELPDVTVR